MYVKQYVKQFRTEKLLVFGTIPRQFGRENEFKKQVRLSLVHDPYSQPLDDYFFATKYLFERIPKHIQASLFL